MLRRPRPLLEAVVAPRPPEIGWVYEGEGTKPLKNDWLFTQPALISRDWNEIPFDSSKNSKVDDFFNALCPRPVGGGRGGGPPVVRNNISGGTTTYQRTENGNLIKYVKRGPRSAGLL